VRLESDKLGTSQEASFRLVRGGRMTTIAPHWRHYLMELPEGPKDVHPSLLPGTASELGKWRGWVDKGWETGVRRADELFEENVSNLARDYAGMMLFRRLAAENLAKGPVTAETLSSMEISDDEIVFERRAYLLTETGRFVDIGERGGE
jgi:defect-in-organelle-trafficking protein DotC